jgi:6-phosphogluconolactonase (cycloisomerase 2 family)
VAYLYVTAAKNTPGQIDEYTVDYQLGSLVPLSASPISSGGNDPVSLVVSTNMNYLSGNQYVYVINHVSSTVVEFSIGSNGALTLANTYTISNGSGSSTPALPTAIAMDSADKFLYVTFQYQGGYSASNPGPGGIAVFPINTNGTLGTQVPNTTVGATSASPLPYYPVGINPVGISIAPSYCVGDPTTGVTPTGTTACTTTTNAAGYITTPAVYVVDQDSVNGVPTGVILPFTQNGSTGALTKISGSTLGGYAAGSVPSAIVVDPTGRYVYVTDEATNQVFGDIVTAGGLLSPMVDSPFPTGILPMGITVDPRGLYLYVANYSSSTVTGFAINVANGTISASGGQTQTATAPMCVTIEPSLGIYLYTANNLDNSVSGLQLNAHTGALTAIPGTPYPASGSPTCAAAAASGSHSTQLLTP